MVKGARPLTDKEVRRGQLEGSIAYHQQQLDKYTDAATITNSLEWVEGMKRYHLKEIEKLQRRLKEEE